MIIKKRDSLRPQLDELEALLALDLPKKKRVLVEKELKVLCSGERGEKDSAYYIDFRWGDSADWMVLDPFEGLLRALTPVLVGFLGRRMFGRSFMPDRRRFRRDIVCSLGCVRSVSASLQ